MESQVDALQVKQTYLSAFSDWEKTALTKDPFWIRESRELALAYFGEAGFPTAKDEDWKYTDLDNFLKVSFALTGDKHSKASILAELKSLGFEMDKAHLMVYVNGHFCKELSTIHDLPKGVKLGSLIENLSNGPLKKHFSHILPFEGHPFVALNYAYFTDGVFLHVPEGQKLEKPLHVVFLSDNSGQPTQSHIRNLILMEKGAKAQMVEHYWGNNLKPYLTNAVTKVSLKQSASLDHTKIQQESDLAFHIGVLAAHQEADSHLNSRVFSLGGALGRSETVVTLSEIKASCVLDGLSLSRGKEHMDLRTFVDHLSPNCESRQTYKLVADGESTGIFSGKVLVRENAQKTDARQVNRNLELSPKAKVYSKPQLMIYADDVKCSHGSATGQLNEEAIFYFQARGIGKEEARRILINAFAWEMVEKVELDYLKGPLGRMVNDWMAGTMTRSKS